MSVYYENIPAELAEPKLWLRYYLARDPKNPNKKARKHPTVKYATAEDRDANLRSLEYLLGKKEPKEGLQRWVNKDEGFVFVDIDKARNPETSAVEPWADELIRELDTYCEISPSGTGFHLVARGNLPEDFHLDPNQVEIYSGNIPNKLIAMTGDVYELHTSINDRQGKLSELLARAKAGDFNRQVAQPQATNGTTPKQWRDVFHTGSELDPTPGQVFIKGILEEGITAIGAASGVGKTWIGLSISHALITGKPLFGTFPVVGNPHMVLYLIPEMGGRKFRERMQKLKIPMDGAFFCQTIRDGACNLQDPLLLAAVNDLHPVVILDTAIRFQAGEENSSTDISQALGACVFNLINHGAKSVVMMHHRAKASVKEAPTLENTLRGTGDFGAMCDCVWAVENATLPGNREDAEYLEESKRLTRLRLTCVKPRDMEPAEPFLIQGRPYIDEKSDFVVLDESQEDESKPRESKAGDEKVLELVRNQPKVGIHAIGRATGFGTPRIMRILNAAGVTKQDKQSEWVFPHREELF